MQHRTPLLYCRATVPTLCFTSKVSIADLLRADAQWMKQIAKMLYVIVVATLALVSLPTPSASQVDNTKLTLPARVINVTAQVCPPDEVRVSERNKVAGDVQGLLRTTTATACQIFQTQSSSAVSCSVLPTSCPSGYYWIRSSNGSAVQVYCDMDRVCGCNGTGGWACVAYLNMTDPNQQYPQVSSPERACRRTSVRCESTHTTLTTLVCVGEWLYTSMEALMPSDHTLIDRYLRTP